MNRVLRSACSLKEVNISHPALSFRRWYNTKHMNLLKNPEYSLAAFIPESVKEWNSDLNGDLLPSQIPYNYNGFVWWKCPHGKDHIWKSKCKSRVDCENRRLLECPFCSNRKVSQTNSLLTRYPQLASEFDMISNDGLKASDVIYCRKKPFFWRCIHNHVYKMTIQKRLEYMEDNQISCPFCRNQDKPSSLLYDYDPERFEESYNWLNCPSLPPPSKEDMVEDELPDEVFKAIDYQELYFNTDDVDHSSQSMDFPLQQHSTPTNMIDYSLQKSLRNHILEYQKWRETLQWNDKRIIWWVCNSNPEHIWRESVRSRIGSYCPFCYKEQFRSKDDHSKDDAVVTF